jgi:hypothetical protein
MAGLVPAIHVLAVAAKNVDARHKAGHDEMRWLDGSEAAWLADLGQSH